MESRLWYTLTGTRGGPNRLRILQILEDRPRNAQKIAEELDLHYVTVQHHLDVLTEEELIERSGDEYGAIYLPTPQIRNHWDVVEEIAPRVSED